MKPKCLCTLQFACYLCRLFWGPKWYASESTIHHWWIMRLGQSLIWLVYLLVSTSLISLPRLLLPRSKLFVHLLSLMTLLLNEIDKSNQWHSETRSKNLSDASHPVSVALTVKSWRHFECNILFLKMQKKINQFYFIQIFMIMMHAWAILCQQKVNHLAFT